MIGSKFRFEVSGFRFLQAALIAAACWFVYSPAFHGDWFWDDPAEITANLALHSRAGLWKIWFAPDSPDYYPFKTTLQWVQWHLWRDHVTGYHLTNVGLHLLSAFLIWHVLRKLGVRLAWLGGLIFAVHPLAVESVAWISELKNVLSLPLLLLAMIFWIDWDKIRWSELPPTRSFGSAEEITPTIHPNEARSGQHAPPFYVASLVCFIAAMLSKSSVVMFPVILLLYAWWKRGRVGWRELLASAPFIAVSVVLGLVTFWFQHNVAMKDIVVVQGGLLPRLAVAGMAIAFYFWKFIWPVDLMPIYPRWAVDPPSLWQFWPWVGGAIATVFIWRWSGLPPTRSFGSAEEITPTILPNEARSGQHAPPVSAIATAAGDCRGVARVQRAKTGRELSDGYASASPSTARHLLFGLGWFVINLLPVLGFVPMSFLRISWVADHFAYLSMVGLVGLAAAAISNFEFRISKSHHPWFPLFAFRFSLFLLLAALAVVARRQAAIFQSEQAVWTHTLAHNPQAWLAHNNLGNILLNEGRVAEAKAQIEEALRLKPDFAEAHNNLGNILLQAGRAEEARAQFEQAIKFRRDYAEAYNGLGNYFLNAGRPEQAMELYERALRIKPDYADCRDNLGAALENLGRTNEAILKYREVLAVEPGFATAHYNLAIALARLHRFPGAVAEYQQALRLNPMLIQAYNNLGNALAAMRRTPEAIAEYERALKLNPNFFEVHINLGNAFFNTRRVPEAIVQYEEALRLEPNYGPGHNSLGIALQAVGRTPDARAQFEAALRIDPSYLAARKNLDLLQSDR